MIISTQSDIFIFKISNQPTNSRHHTALFCYYVVDIVWCPGSPRRCLEHTRVCKRQTACFERNFSENLLMLLLLSLRLQAENFNQEGNPVLALRGAKVSDFGGCSVSVSGQTVMTFQPDIVEAHDLKQW